MLTSLAATNSTLNSVVPIGEPRIEKLGPRINEVLRKIEREGSLISSSVLERSSSMEVMAGSKEMISDLAKLISRPILAKASLRKWHTRAAVETSVKKEPSSQN